MVSIDGIPVEFVTMPGAPADIQGLAELPLALPEAAAIALDSAYSQYEWEDLAETDKIRLLVTRKSNSKRRDAPALHDYKFWLQHRIETVFGEITKLFPKKIHQGEL
jgi:IS5 family transposase